MLVRVALYYMAAVETPPLPHLKHVGRWFVSFGARVKASRKRFCFDWLEVDMSELGFGLLRPTQVMNKASKLSYIRIHVDYSH